MPDINTSVCSIQTKTFNKTMDQFPDVNFLTISTNTIKDQQNWCAAEGVKNMQLMSLQDYYDTPKDKVDPEMIDWLMGGEAIDLDKFDKEELNQRMEQYKN